MMSPYEVCQFYGTCIFYFEKPEKLEWPTFTDVPEFDEYQYNASTKETVPPFSPEGITKAITGDAEGAAESIVEWFLPPKEPKPEVQEDVRLFCQTHMIRNKNRNQKEKALLNPLLVCSIQNRKERKRHSPKNHLKK